MHWRMNICGLHTMDCGQRTKVLMHIKTDFDPSLGQINIIPQDIGRVLLNLYNNAFYAVAEKQKLSGDDYQPTVTIHTNKINGEVEISVADNGNGIPEKVMDKVFQPFFTKANRSGNRASVIIIISYHQSTSGQDQYQQFTG